MVPARPAPSCLAVALTALGLVGVAVAGDLWLLRSFEFVPFPAQVPTYRPPEPPEAPSVAPIVPEDPRPSRGVTLVLMDGLRLDTSRELPALEALRAEGADVVTRALFPTFTRTGSATLFTGAGPRVHGFMSNFNRRPSPVPSLAHVARRAGATTRSYWDVPRPEYRMFPGAVDVEGRLAELVGSTGADVAAVGSALHLTRVYMREPDLSGHQEGADSEAYREAARASDAKLARIRDAVDLERETLVVTSDHGHLAQGGHGGTEPEVVRVPLVLAGAGVREGVTIGPGARSDLRDVIPTVAVLLDIPWPHTATGKPLYDVLRDPPAERPVPGAPARAAASAVAAGLRGLGGAVLFGLLPFLVLRPGGLRPVLAVAVAGAAFLGAYAVLGHPFSFSCVNSEREVPWFMLEVLGLAAGGAAVGAVLSGDGLRYAGALLTAAAAAVGATWLGCGLGAPTALAWPQLTFLAHLAFTGLLGAALVAPGAALLIRSPGGGSEEVAEAAPVSAAAPPAAPRPAGLDATEEEQDATEAYGATEPPPLAPEPDPAEPGGGGTRADPPSRP